MRAFWDLGLNFPPLRWCVYAFRYLSWRRLFPKAKFDYGCHIKNSIFGDSVRLSRGCKVLNSSLGRFSYVGENTVISRSDIGKFTCIGPGVLVNLGSHPTYRKSIHPAFYSESLRAAKTFVTSNSYVEYDNVTIGNDVWIGARALILGGASVPDGTIISAGSVVKKGDKLRPYGIYGGSPLVLLKMRKYGEDYRVSDRWWELEDQILRERLDEFS